jgi:hypothetical protein
MAAGGVADARGAAGDSGAARGTVGVAVHGAAWDAWAM